MPACSTPNLPPSPTIRQRPFLLRRTSARRYFDDQPPVPLLPATKLQMDLLLGQPTCDLQIVAEVVLSDVGATLQLLRSRAQHSTFSDPLSERVDDSLLHIGRSGLRRILSATLQPARGPCVRAARQLWQRAQLTASLAKIMAGRFAGLSPEQAHLAGLLHEIGRLPALLGWSVSGLDLGDVSTVGRVLLQEWQLPAYLAAILRPASGPRPTGASLPAVVAIARKLAEVLDSEGRKPWTELQRSIGSPLLSIKSSSPSVLDALACRPFLVS